MEIKMAKKDVDSTDIISEGTLHEILLDIKYRLDHLEDMEADNRALMVKMVKQSNSIVKFLANIDIEGIDDTKPIIQLPSTKNEKSMNSERMKQLKELVDEYMDRHKDLKELEEELEKNKDKLTPGQAGEA